MRNRVQIALVLAGLLLLSGCGLVGHYEIKGENMLTLDQAIARAKSNEYSCVSNLWDLWEQAPPEDKIVVEQEILKVILQSEDTYREPKEDALRNLRSKAFNEEVKKTVDEALRKYEQARQAQQAETERQREEEQVQAQKQAEEIRRARKESRQRLIHEAGGKLDDKSAEQVKKLVDEWTRTRTLADESWSDPQLFGTTDFYKAFGQPRRKQLIGGHYYFYYDCRDGIVQIEVDASFLDKAGCIIVSDLNIL